MVERPAISGETIAAMSVLTEDGFCLCEMIVDDEGVPVDYRFLEINHRFEEMTGLRDPVGRTALDLVPNLERHWVDYYARVGLGGERLQFEEGSEAMGRWFEVFATPVRPTGRFIIVFRDISERRKAEAERESALAHAERLLEELNHRVMNNLSIMASVVSMEARALQDEFGADALSRITGRLNALAHLYEQLSVSRTVDMVSMRPYLDRVLAALSRTFEGSGVAIEARIEDAELPTGRAINVGLMVNELVTNSVKHAFRNSEPGTVTVAFGPAETGYSLTVSDDGAGLASEEAPGQGIGQRLVGAFVAQLEGDHSIRTGQDGTAVSIAF